MSRKLLLLSLQGLSSLTQPGFFFCQSGLLRDHGGRLDPQRITFSLQRCVAAWRLGSYGRRLDKLQLERTDGDAIFGTDPDRGQGLTIDQGAAGIAQVAHLNSVTTPRHDTMGLANIGCLKPDVAVGRSSDQCQGMRQGLSDTAAVAMNHHLTQDRRQRVA
jgi:hypothetical protein